MSDFSLRADGCPEFRGNAIPHYRNAQFDLWPMLGLEPARFVAEANRLFDKYLLAVPDGYPNKCEVKDAFDVRGRRPEVADELRRIADQFEGAGSPDAKPAFDTFESLLAAVRGRLDQFRIHHIAPWDTLAEAVAFCVLIEADHGVGVGSILKDIIGPNSREGILHGATTAAVVLHCLRAGIPVEIVARETEKKTPDLLVGGVTCDVKVVEQWDVAADVSWETGRSQDGRLADDLCYDVGAFITHTAAKGMKQADLILADLSRKSMGVVQTVGEPKRRQRRAGAVMTVGLPPPQKHRIVLFARRILDFISTFVDFDPALWRLVREDRVSGRTAVISLPARPPIKL